MKALKALFLTLVITVLLPSLLLAVDYDIPACVEQPCDSILTDWEQANPVDLIVSGGANCLGCSVRVNYILRTFDCNEDGILDLRQIYITSTQLLTDDCYTWSCYSNPDELWSAIQNMFGTVAMLSYPDANIMEIYTASCVTMIFPSFGTVDDGRVLDPTLGEPIAVFKGIIMPCAPADDACCKKVFTKVEYLPELWRWDIVNYPPPPAFLGCNPFYGSWDWNSPVMRCWYSCSAYDYQFCMCPPPGKIATTDELLSSNLSIYPNPADDFVNISYSGDTDGTVVILIYNEVGEEVYRNSQSLNGSKIILGIDTQSFVNGTYFVKITENEQILGNASFVINK